MNYTKLFQRAKVPRNRIKDLLNFNRDLLKRAIRDIPLVTPRLMRAS